MAKEEVLLLPFQTGELRLAGGEADLTTLMMTVMLPDEHSGTSPLLWEFLSLGNGAACDWPLAATLKDFLLSVLTFQTKHLRLSL